MLPFRMSRRALLAAPLLSIPLGGGKAVAAEGEWNGFLASVRRDAMSRGVRASTLDFVFRYIEYLPKVIELDRHQPERTKTFAEFIATAVTPQREGDGRRALQENWDLLQQVQRTYNVQPRFVVALWGIETAFGKITGNYFVPASLATLAYDGRRGALFRDELINALKILDEGDITPHDMLGSWAGAMGQCQFMPSTFLRYAVDFDHDGRRDIWGDRADALGSIANYIAQLGWRGDEGWGQTATVPANFDARNTGLDYRRPIAQWAQLGVRGTDGQPPAGREQLASLVLPDGAGPQALLVNDNFRVIMRWNKSTFFAASVGYLADGIGRG
jgi:membrane-bound lytic murein transglycosylase B